MINLNVKIRSSLVAEFACLEPNIEHFRDIGIVDVVVCVAEKNRNQIIIKLSSVGKTKQLH